MSTPAIRDDPTELRSADSAPPARVVANSAWLMLSQGVSIVLTGCVGIYAVRNFSTNSWGHFSTAIALVGVFTIFSGPGLATLGLREMTANFERQGEILGMSLRAIAWTFFIAAVGLFIATYVLGYPDQVRILILILTPLLALTPLSTTLAAAFNARSRLGAVALVQVLQSLLYATLAVLIISASLGIEGFAVATVTAAVCGIVLTFFLLSAKLGVRPRFDQPRRKALSFLRDALPFAGLGLVGVVYDRVDTLMLSVLSGATDVAHYTVPYGFLQLTWILPSIVSATFFPLLSRKIDSESSEAEYLFFLVVRVFLFLSLPIALMLAVSSPTLLPFLFGPRYDPSIPVLQILAWAAVFAFPSFVFWYGVLAAHRERAVLVIRVVTLVVNVGLNAFLIPLYGPIGAAVSFVISDLVLVVGQGLVVHRNLFHIPLSRLLVKPIGATALAVPAALLVATWSAVGGAIVGGGAYVGILLVFGYVTLDEWRPVTAVVEAPFTRLRRRGA